MSNKLIRAPYIPRADKEKKRTICQICKKTITDTKSIQRGMGESCYQKELLKNKNKLIKG